MRHFYKEIDSAKKEIFSAKVSIPKESVRYELRETDNGDIVKFICKTCAQTFN